MDHQDSKVQDYECFVRSVLQDFDERVFAVQKRTEENVKGKVFTNLMQG